MRKPDQALSAALAEADLLRQRMREDRAKRVRKLLADGLSMAEVGRRLGMHITVVRSIRDGRWYA